jgi:Tfp pilus assembly protein PilF
MAAINNFYKLIFISYCCLATHAIYCNTFLNHNNSWETVESNPAVALKLKENLAKTPEDTAARKLYADLLFDLKQWPEAEKQYKILLQNPESKYYALAQLVYISFIKNRLADAKNYLLELTNNTFYRSMAYFYLGLIEKQYNNLSLALQNFEKASQMGLENNYTIRSSINTINILLKRKKENDLTKAHALLKYIFQTVANPKEFFLSEAQFLYQEKLYTEAFDLLNFLEKKLPNEQDISYSIAIAAKALNNHEIFTKKIHHVLTMAPNNIDALNALGWYHYNQQNYDKAYELLLQAFHNDNYNTTQIPLRLGAVLWRLNLKHQANEIWQKTLLINNNSQEVTKLITKYKHI